MLEWFDLRIGVLDVTLSVNVLEMLFGTCCPLGTFVAVVIWFVNFPCTLSNNSFLAFNCPTCYMVD